MTISIPPSAALADTFKAPITLTGTAMFEVMGDPIVMIVDVDHNDTDDRQAIVIMAYLMAAANSQRRLEVCT